jgi:polyphosphate kinase
MLLHHLTARAGHRIHPHPVTDPRVIAIKQTVYRTGTDSSDGNLIEAARKGKEATVVVELMARSTRR